MKLDEAIKDLKLGADIADMKGYTKRVESLKLGINALIFYRKLKSLNTGEIQGNFIGETEE